MENDFLATDKVFQQLKSHLLSFSRANMIFLAWVKKIWPDKKYFVQDKKYFVWADGRGNRHFNFDLSYL